MTAAVVGHSNQSKPRFRVYHFTYGCWYTRLVNQAPRDLSKRRKRHAICLYECALCTVYVCVTSILSTQIRSSVLEFRLSNWLDSFDRGKSDKIYYILFYMFDFFLLLFRSRLSFYCFRLGCVTNTEEEEKNWTEEINAAWSFYFWVFAVVVVAFFRLFTCNIMFSLLSCSSQNNDDDSCRCCCFFVCLLFGFPFFPLFVRFFYCLGE